MMTQDVLCSQSFVAVCLSRESRSVVSTPAFCSCFICFGSGSGPFVHNIIYNYIKCDIKMDDIFE